MRAKRHILVLVRQYKPWTHPERRGVRDEGPERGEHVVPLARPVERVVVEPELLQRRGNRLARLADPAGTATASGSTFGVLSPNVDGGRATLTGAAERPTAPPRLR